MSASGVPTWSKLNRVTLSAPVGVTVSKLPTPEGGVEGPTRKVPLPALRVYRTQLRVGGVFSGCLAMSSSVTTTVVPPAACEERRLVAINASAATARAQTNNLVILICFTYL